MTVNSITVKALQEGLLIWLRTNGDRRDVCIDSFYIGKTENMDDCKERHHAEGYCDTIEIAHGDASDIKEAEPIIVDCLLRSKFGNKCNNKEPNTKGNNDADKLYIAYFAHYKESGEAVEEGELSWPNSFELVGKKGMKQISDYLRQSLEKDTQQEWLEEVLPDEDEE